MSSGRASIARRAADVTDTSDWLRVPFVSRAQAALVIGDNAPDPFRPWYILGMSENLATRELKDEIKRLIVDRLKLEVDPSSIGDADPLFGEGLGLDSIDALELVLGVEQVLGVKIEDEEMGSKALGSVQTLADFVAGKRAAVAV